MAPENMAARISRSLKTSARTGEDSSTCIDWATSAPWIELWYGLFLTKIGFYCNFDCFNLPIMMFEIEQVSNQHRRGDFEGFDQSSLPQQSVCDYC